MEATPHGQRPESQASRRLKFGANVLVAAIAAGALVVALNWIAYRKYQRFDLTATRQYSLSQQTHNVLSDLEHEVRLVTLFRANEGDPYLRQIRDLIDEYGRYSPRLTVEHLNVDLDLARREAFFADVLSRYERELTEVSEAVERGREALRRVAVGVEPVLELLQEASAAMAEDESIRQFFQAANAQYRRMVNEIDQRDRAIEAALDDPLPDYGGAHGELLAQLRGWRELFNVTIAELEKASRSPSASPAVQDVALRLIERVKAARQSLEKDVSAVESASVPQAYDELRESLVSMQGVVVMGPSQVTMIPASEMYREPDAEQVRQAGRPELRFLGEERLTGALVSMQMDQPPLVVFVLSGRGEAIGPRGQYEQVASRLRAVNFDVQQWNPAGQMSQFGQPTPPAPMPQPEPGQRAVWVFLPAVASNPSNPMMPPNLEPLGDVLRQRLGEGDSVMVMVEPNPSAMFSPEDPIRAELEPWGITPQVDRIILEQRQLPDRQTRAAAQFEVNRWSDGLAVTRALSGMPGVFLFPCPLVVAADVPEVEHYTLIELEGPNLWAERDISMLNRIAEAEFDEAESQDSFTIGVAAEKGDQRLVVVAASGWASDQITTYGFVPGLGGGAGMADLVGAAFPANSELFVNSVYWLAGLDELIAASPRTQDIRRIADMSPAERSTYKWLLLAGMPIAILAGGVGVWLVRRQG